jgi:hypothetical protein
MGRESGSATQWKFGAAARAFIKKSQSRRTA